MLSDLMLRILNPVTDDMFDTMLTEPYANNPLVMMTIMEKLTMRAIAEARPNRERAFSAIGKSFENLTVGEATLKSTSVI